MEKRKYKPPKTNYEQKEELLSEIHSMQEKMESHKEEYEEKEQLLENMAIVKKRKSSVVMVFVIAVVLRVMLSDHDLITYDKSN